MMTNSLLLVSSHGASLRFLQIRKAMRPSANTPYQVMVSSGGASLHFIEDQRIHTSSELVWVRSLIFFVRRICDTTQEKNSSFKPEIAARFAEFCALHKSRQIGEVLYA